MAQSYGLKISLPGSNVLTAADKDLVYSSKFNGMKIAKHNTLASAGTVAHGLAYVPMYLNYVKIGTFYELETDVVSPGTYKTFADTTNITFTSSGNYYFIFIDNSN